MSNGKPESERDAREVSVQDPVEEAVREAARAVTELREELARERALVVELSSQTKDLHIRCETLKEELEDHKRERAYYQTAAATMAAGLENVGMIWADLVHKANAAARRQVTKSGYTPEEPAKIRIPKFLRNGNGNGAAMRAESVAAAASEAD
jgi:chromosome segregation ATPase